MNTLLLYSSLSPYSQTDGLIDRRTDGETNLSWLCWPPRRVPPGKRIYPCCAGHPDGFLQVYPGCAGNTLTGSSRFISSCAVVSVFCSSGTLASCGLEEPAHASRGLEELFFQLCCCVSFWFQREIGFGFTYYLCTQGIVPYSCGFVLVFLVLAGNSFHRYVHAQCTIQLCDCVSFLVMAGNVITTGKKKFKSSVWGVRNRYYDRKKKFQS